MSDVANLLAGLPRLWRYPELYLAARADADRLSPEQLRQAILRGFIDDHTPTSAARTLLALGAWQAAEQLLDETGFPADDPLRAEVRDGQDEWLAAATVTLAWLTTRARLGGEPELAADVIVDRESERQETMLALELIEAEVSAAEAQAGAGELSNGHSTGREPRGPWPWSERRVDQCLEWFDSSAAVARPPGFAPRWDAPESDPEAQAMLAHLRAAAAATDPHRQLDGLGAALALGVGGDWESGPGQLTMRDPRLAFFGLTDTPLAVTAREGNGTRGGMVLGGPDGERLTVSWGDLLAALGAGAERRRGLLGLICAQARPIASARGASAASVGELVSGWIELAGLDPQPQLTMTVADLSAGLPEIAAALTAELIAVTAPAGVARADVLTAAWSSAAFRDRAAAELRTLLGGAAMSLLRAAAQYGEPTIGPENAGDLLSLAGEEATAMPSADAALRALADGPLMVTDGDVLQVPPSLARLVNHVM